MTSVAVEPTGSNVARTGTFVSIDPMWRSESVASSQLSVVRGRGDRARRVALS
jgi:hypothetical protein